MPHPPFALALGWSTHNSMLQFLSYGVLPGNAQTAAIDGPAAGIVPVDLGIVETHYEQYDRTSMSLTGDGWWYYVSPQAISILPLLMIYHV